MLNEEVQLVLTHGRVCSVVYFYVRYLIPVNSPKKVVKFSAHRFATIGDLKVRIAGKTGLQANSIQLYLNPSYPLDNNLNIYECGVQNGSSLFCALPQWRTFLFCWIHLCLNHWQLCYLVDVICDVIGFPMFQ